MLIFNFLFIFVKFNKFGYPIILVAQVIFLFLIGCLFGKFFVYDFLGIDFSSKTLFWVTSTIIQSLAALIALVAMFYIYKMTPITKTKNQIGEKLRMIREEVAAKLLQLQIPNYYDIDESKIDIIEIERFSDKAEIYKELDKKYKEKVAIIKRVTFYLKNSIFWAVFSIILSLLLLPFGELTSSNYRWNIPIMSIAITIEIIFAITTVSIIGWYLKTVIEI